MSDHALILVADDEPDVAELIRGRLQRRGYRTVLAADGLEALNTALARRPDLVILDLLMPKLTGLEVCRMLKVSPLTQHVPILMLTALATTEDKVRGLASGADDYVTKPFEVAELLARVDMLLRRRNVAVEN